MDTELTQDILEAFHNLGGEEFLASNPDLLDKILLRINTVPDAPPELTLVVEVPWLSPDRLSYRHHATNTEDAVQDVSPKTVSPPPSGQWKEPQPAPTGMSTLIHSLKDAK